MILVTGATGNVGRPLVDLLVHEGAKVRAVTRNPQAAGLPAGVEVVEGNPSRPDTMTAAVDGVTTLFVNPAAVGTAVDELMAVAEQRGVTRVVTISANNIDDDVSRQPSRQRGHLNREAEAAVVASGLAWVSLRASFYATNTVMWAAQIRAGDAVRGPYADATEAPLDPRDLAAVGARALLSDDIEGRVEVTGPQSLTQAEMVGVIGEVIGKSLRYEETPPQAANEGLTRLGFSAQFIEANLARLAHSVGVPARTTTEVARITGRPANGYAHWGRRPHRTLPELS